MYPSVLAWVRFQTTVDHLGKDGLGWRSVLKRSEKDLVNFIRVAVVDARPTRGPLREKRRGGPGRRSIHFSCSSTGSHSSAGIGIDREKMMQQNDFMMCVSAMDYNSPMLNSTVPPITVERPFVNAVSSPLSELLAESDEDEDFFRLDTLKPRSYSFGAQPQRAFFNKTDTRRFLHNITKGQSKTPKPAKTTTVSRFSLMKQPPYVVNGATTTAASYNNNNDALMLRQQLQLRQQHQQALSGPSSSHSSATAASVTLANVHYMPSSQHHITAYPMGGQPGPVLPPTPSGELEELEPVRRDRCNTWPAVRANLDIKAQTSPLIHEEIPEEENVYDSSENINSGGSQLCCGLMGSPDPDRNDGFSPNGMCSPIPGSGNIGSGGSDTSETGQPNSANKKSSTRRNAWGNMSYADLITQAINSSPEKRLTLSQVYEWMVQNVPYFRDKGDSNSSAGWKNSIRHNLSLHSRFMRIQNEGAGKSSWWVINPDAKPGRNPRRQRSHTMETTTKTAIEKKRRGARKKVMELQQRAGGPLHSNGSSVVGSQISLASRDLYPNDEDVMNNYDAPFRNRADSNLSVPGTISRVSPTMNHFDDSLDFPAWVEAETTYNSANVSVPHDIVRDTSNIQLDPSSGGGRPMNNASTSPYRRHPTANSVMKGGTSPLQVKQEPLDVKDKDSYQPPPSYQELRTVPLNDHHQRANQLQQNPLLISQLPHLSNPKITGIGMGQQAVYYAPNGAYTLPPQPSQQTNSTSGGGATIQHWPMQHNSVGCGIPAQFGGGQSALPNDLAGLTFEQGPFESMDTESLLRQELAMNSTLSFDNI